MDSFTAPQDHGAWEFDVLTGETTWSAGLYRIHGVVPGEFEPTMASARGLVHPDDLHAYQAAVAQAIARKAPFSVQHRIITADGTFRALLVRGAYVAGSGDEHDRLIGTTQDVSGRELPEDRLWHMANHDSLTGLFNRRRFMDELSRELAFSRRSGQSGAVLMLDLDGFKDINDSLGHTAGDQLLVRIAGQFQARLRATDSLARLGGDEFAAVLAGCTPSEARDVATQLLDVLTYGAGVSIRGRERHVTASIGIAPFGPGQEESAENLLANADLAMYKAKGGGRGVIATFDAALRAELAARVETEGELRDALKNGEFELYYQPIVALESGMPVGCEALLRWRHPDQGVVAPEAFIRIAEERGLISEIGRWVLRTACAEAQGWRRRGVQAYVSVNVSPVQLVRDDVAAEVAAVLADTKLPAPLLYLEITETSAIDDADAIAPALNALKRLGVRIAIDDFGGGTSSLSFLSQLPIDVIKIDQLFVRGLPARPDDRAIVAAVISLAEELDLPVIAEGVETERQNWELRELGCGLAQGFLYSPPCPLAELDLSGYSAAVQPGVGDPSVIREFMRQIGIPARIGA